MKSWTVAEANRLLTEIKNKCVNRVKDLKWSIEHNRCFVNNLVERFGSRRVKRGDCISIWIEKSPLFCKESDRILYEDAHLLVYNKPPYLTSEKLGSLTHCLLVHRLDRDTSGLILLAKNREAQSLLEKQFKERAIHKEYFAWVQGITEPQGIISGKMGPLARREGAVVFAMVSNGLWSQTEWRRVDCKDNRSLLLCTPLTGRTHQIRVHLKHIGHPIIGDFTYGSKEYADTFRPLLHASALFFTHPLTKETLSFSLPPPPDFF
jgi:23S rRNA pseudouridine955/2504/2580 synthase